MWKLKFLLKFLLILNQNLFSVIKSALLDYENIFTDYFTHCNVTAEDEGKGTMEDFCSLPMCQDLKAQLGEE